MFLDSTTAGFTVTSPPSASTDSTVLVFLVSESLHPSSKLQDELQQRHASEQDTEPREEKRGKKKREKKAEGKKRGKEGGGI
jgi:hypothetical protein